MTNIPSPLAPPPMPTFGAIAQPSGGDNNVVPTPPEQLQTEAYQAAAQPAPADAQTAAADPAERAAPPSPPTSQAVQQEQVVQQPVLDSQPVQAPAIQQAASVPVVAEGGRYPTDPTITGQMESFGFVGVNFDGYGVLSTITLNGSEFQKDGELLTADGFRARINSSRNKILYSYGDKAKPELPNGLMYTYDDQTNANDPGKTVAEFLAEANRVNAQVKRVLYYEVDAVLDDTSEPVKLSVPVAGSGNAFARFLTSCASVMRDPRTAKVWVTKGPKVTSVAHPFYPWEFKIEGWA